MKIYTRTGDDGTTGLFGAGRIRKSELRIDAYGTVDETNATIGLAVTDARSQGIESSFMDLLTGIQQDLFVLGGELASPGEQKYPVPRIQPSHVEALESAIDRLEDDLQPLKRFILPGGSRTGAALHLARTVCRRAERLVVALAEQEEVADDDVRYLNRLSDFLFVAARWVNHSLGEPEVEWEGAGRG